MDEMEKRKAEKEARPYQIELLNKALKQNSIVYLGTGAGKTFIATMMIKEKMSAILHDNKKTVFLAHRVPLVTQQSKFIKDNTPLTVRSFSGGSFFQKLLRFKYICHRAAGTSLKMVRTDLFEMDPLSLLQPP